MTAAVPGKWQQRGSEESLDRLAGPALNPSLHHLMFPGSVSACLSSCSCRFQVDSFLSNFIEGLKAISKEKEEGKEEHCSLHLHSNSTRAPAVSLAEAVETQWGIIPPPMPHFKVRERCSLWQIT